MFSSTSVKTASRYVYKACLREWFVGGENIFESGEALPAPGWVQPMHAERFSCQSSTVWNSLVPAVKTHLSWVRNLFEWLSGRVVSVLQLRQIIPVLLKPLYGPRSTWMKPWDDEFWSFKNVCETHYFTCTQEERVRKGLHSSCSGRVLVDMARLYKILRAVSSQRPVSKHAASVCLRVCLTLRPQSASSVRVKLLCSAGQGRDTDQTNRFCQLNLKLLKQSISEWSLAVLSWKCACSYHPEKKKTKSSENQ